MEHVSDFLCQADAGSAVGSDVDSWDATLSCHLGSLLEQNVFLGSKRAYFVCDVIADHNNLTTSRVLRASESHPPSNHANLEGHMQTMKLAVKKKQYLESKVDIVDIQHFKN